MNPHRLTSRFVCIYLILFSLNSVLAQKQRTPRGGRIAVVVDERLSALRATPQLTGKLIRRIGRGRLVAIKAVKTGRDGIVFYFVDVTSRTHGWIQREAVVAPSHSADDQRLLVLIKSSSDFDRIARARIFLDYFLHSTLRPEVLLLLGDAAELASEKLTRDAVRRITSNNNAPEFSYFLNYSGLDRYDRQNVRFVYDPEMRRFHYDGAAWREILRRFHGTPQAVEARKRLAELAVSIRP